MKKPITISKHTGYQPKGDWDVTGLSEDETISLVERTLGNFDAKQCRPAEDFFRELDERSHTL